MRGPVQDGTFDLHDAADIVVEGAMAVDRLGSSVAIGDVNGDGHPDLITGASMEDPTDSGAAYVIYGNIFDRESTPEESSLPQILMGAAVVIILILAGGLGTRYVRRTRRSAIQA